MDNKPIIKINLKPHLYDFLLHEFNRDEKGKYVTTDHVLLTRRNDIGLFIDSMWSVSDVPVKQEFENPCSILLPTAQENHYVIQFNFLYFSKWKELQVNEYLEAIWRRRIRDFFSVGYQKGYKQNDIINGILMAFNIKKNAISFDMIKKLDYRNRQNFIKTVANEIESAIIQ